MTIDLVRDISAQVFRTVLMVSGPALAVSLVAGLLIGIFQTVTQIQEFTLSFVPKIVAVFVSLFVLAPWLARVMVSFTTGLITSIPNYIK
ncbi:MAG: flagellar biosynthesis protein FliQ [Nitrospiraceae bacterium]|nr:flagellar biosynthesis protein FliQ [Nitrospiraceae bacterium]